MQATQTGLNTEQKKAVEHIEGPMLILAGAGSGKTKVVTERILHLLQIGIPSSEILAVTFTNKAAEEMKHRILKAANTHVLTSTFHSLSARILRESIMKLGYGTDFLILDEDDSEKALKECFSTLGIKEDKNLLKTTKKQISQAKSDLSEPDQISDTLTPFKQIYRLYQTKLKQYNALDFDDLLFLTVKLFQEFPDVLAHYQKRWTFILIDEYQDTNHAQYLLIKLLSEKHNNIFAVGDPDQSIYSWRGADIANILRFEKDYKNTKVVRLEQNYRSSNTILEAANALIQNNEGRLEKNLWSTKAEGEKIGLYIAYNEKQEAEFVAQKIQHFYQNTTATYKDCAIFYRTNFQSRTFEDALLRAKIPYKIIGGLSFYQRKEIKDILALLRMLLSDTDFLAFSRSINIPKRGIGPSALDKLQETSLKNGIGIFPLCKQILSKTADVKLSAKQLQGLYDYCELIEKLRQENKEGKSVSQLLLTAVEKSRYIEYLKEDLETYAEKKENIEELIAKAVEWQQEVETPSLTLFLEEIALKPSAESAQEPDDCVKLMTLHSGKGLEFPIVFLVGLEESLFPHLNSKDSPLLLEEERRLCYVGITRAKEHLYLTAARMRFLWGSSRDMTPSRFLQEIPTKFLKTLSSSPSYSYRKEDDFYEPESLEEGDSVFHKDFGPGTLERVYTTSIGLTYDVFFIKENKTRSLSAKYAKLTKGNDYS